MPENETNTLEQKETKPVAASFGSPQRVQLNGNNQSVAEEKKEVQEEDKNTEGQEGKATEQELPKLTDEQRKAFFSELGVEYNGEESLAKVKEKLNYTPPSAEPTEEENAAAALAEEKEILDLFIAGGGTPETFVAIKNVINADVKELSRSEKIAELVTAGFDKDEAEAILKERYYQVQLDEMKWDEDGDETEEEFNARKAKLEKKVAFFSSKLENSAAAAKKQAQDLYNNFKQVISDRKLAAKKEREHAANAEAFLKTLPREQTFELGKLNDQELAPVLHKVDEADIAAVKDIIISPAKIQQFLFNEDGSYNLANLTDALLARQSKNNIARNALLEGQTRQVAVFRKQFPASTPHELGVGGAPQKGSEKGKVTSFGKPQRVNN